MNLVLVHLISFCMYFYLDFCTFYILPVINYLFYAGPILIAVFCN